MYFMLRAEANTSTLGLLIHSLICPHNALCKGGKIIPLQLTWLTLLGGNNLDHVYLNGDMSIEVKNPRTFLQ